VCPRLNSKLAVVVPYYSDCKKLEKFLTRWKEKSFFPCKLKSKVDLIFSSGLSPQNPNKCETTISNFLHQTTQNGNPSNCFRNITQTFEDLEKQNHDAGSKTQFVQILKRLSSTYDYLFLMESDTQPIRNNWLQKLQIESFCGEDFLIKGSQYRMAAKPDILASGWHINGNALYKLNSPKSTWLIESVTASIMYDVAYGKYLANAENAQVSKDILHLYKYSDFIQNIFHETKWNSFQVAAEHPNTYFVHGSNFVDEPL